MVDVCQRANDGALENTQFALQLRVAYGYLVAAKQRDFLGKFAHGSQYRLLRAPAFLAPALSMPLCKQHEEGDHQQRVVLCKSGHQRGNGRDDRRDKCDQRVDFHGVRLSELPQIAHAHRV